MREFKNYLEGEYRLYVKPEKIYSMQCLIKINLIRDGLHCIALLF